MLEGEEECEDRDRLPVGECGGAYWKGGADRLADEGRPS